MKWFVRAALVASLALSGCSKEPRILRPHQAPTLTLHHAILTGPDGVRVHHLRWAATDPDGVVDHYIYAADPASPDRVDDTWTSTDGTETELELRAARPGEPQPQPRMFVVRAVDRGGVMTDPVSVPLVEYLPIPPVSIVRPRPSALLQSLVPSSLRIEWTGLDPGAGTGVRLLYYAYRLFSEDEPDFDLWKVFPDSLRRRYAPTFEGWEFVDPSVTSVLLEELVVDKRYLFVVTGVDAAGDVDPVFSLNKNMLQMRVGQVGLLGPRLTFFNESFHYDAPPGYFGDPVLHPTTVPAGEPLTIHWIATPLLGHELIGTHWVLDPSDLLDETPRIDPGDTGHWSGWGSETSATLGPFPVGGVHRFYVEARDNFGSLSNGGIQITVTAPAAAP